MRFLFFPGGSYIGGLEMVTLALMRELRVQGHPCFAIVSGWNDGRYPAQLSEADIPHQSVKLGRAYLSKPRWTLDGLVNLPRASRDLRGVIERFRPDVMVLTSVEFALTVVHFVPKSVPLAIHLHDVPNRHWRSWLGGHVLGRSKGVITVSDFIRERVLNVPRFNLPVRTVHNGLPPARNQVPRSHSAKLRIGIIGQLLPRKRHHVLVEAVRLLDPGMRDRIEVRIYGANTSPYALGVDRHIQQAGLVDSFRWMGFVALQADIYGNLDVVVAPAVEEPFGTTILEAGSYGLPAVAARSGGFPEMVVDGVTGLLVPPDDAKALAQALERLLDENLRASLGERACEHISRNFTVKAMAENYVAAIQEFGVRGAA
jgi:glycosyltransferase involved in cell wall biosynthesis